MYRLIKFITISFIPVSAVLLILLFINILVLDFQYAHKSLLTYQNPFNWASYKFEINLLKFIKNLKNNKIIGLEEKKIFITEKSQKNLLSNVPMSTKKWQDGFFLSDNNNFKEIKIRYRGDNPRNWLFEKKNIRIKSKKKSQFGSFRYYDYDPFQFEKYVSGRIANRTKVISPKFKLIELYINDNSEGIYIQTEKINENFLRRNKIMPVNVYKGEQINSESIIKTNDNLFNNQAIWKKAAIFNQTDYEDKSDLINFLNLLRKSETNSISREKLFSMLDISEWAKFAAYQIITDNYHNDNGHNMRLIFDTWSGKVRPIIYDPILGYGIFNKNEINLNKSSHDLLLFLNKNSLFIDKKYKELFNLITTENIIQNELNDLKILEEKILISEKRDIELQRIVFSNFGLSKKINPIHLLNLSNSKKRFSIIKNLEEYNKQLKNKFYQKPNATWSYSKNKINLNISEDLPVSNIKVFFKQNVPKWISLDLNGDKFVSKYEKFSPDKNGIFNLPVTLYANRTIVAKDKYELIQPQIITTKTRFEFKIENSSIPYKIQAQNLFSNETLDLKIDNSITLPANNFNLPIINSSITDETLILDGIVEINRNTIFKKKLNIKPGTKFLIKENVNIIFLNKVMALGTKENPIIFKSIDKLNNWGGIVLQGNGTQDSVFRNIIINGGSGGKIDQLTFTAMFSIHNSNNILLKNMTLLNNKNYDDSLHLVYCKNVVIDNVRIKDAFSDAIDIDISDNILIKNSKFDNPKNDSIDTMESSVIIDSSEITSSGDKGISVGENSNVIVHNTLLSDNIIGIAVKDNSTAKVYYTDFINNNLQVGSYQKNYKYGTGGQIEIIRSNFKSESNKIESDNKSLVTIDNSSFNKKIYVKNSNINLTKDVNFKGDKTINKDINIDKSNLLITSVENVKNNNLRGSDFINN